MVIPSIPARADLLGEALGSAWRQTLPAMETCVAVDTARRGAAATRQRALEMASGEWVAFLDDDDYFLPGHLAVLRAGAMEHKADYVFSWFVRAQGGDPLGHFGKVFNELEPHHTTMTVMVRRELAMEAGFADYPGAGPAAGWSGEDWRFTLRCIGLGAHIVHIPQETWVWRRHKGNTSGVPGKGDAK